MPLLFHPNVTSIHPNSLSIHQQGVEIFAPVSTGEGEQQGHHVDQGIYANELLLQENPMRFVLFPINHDAIWHMYKKVNVANPSIDPTIVFSFKKNVGTPLFVKSAFLETS